MKRIPIFLCFVHTYMSHKVDKCVFPSRIIVGTIGGYPITYSVEMMLDL